MPANSTAAEVFRFNIRSVLNDRGMTIQQLADKMSVSAVNISRILSGKEGVTIERAERIAGALGFPLAALLTEKFLPVA